MAMKYNMEKLVPQTSKVELAKVGNLFNEPGGDSKLNELLGIENKENRETDEVVEISIDDIRDFGGNYGKHRFVSNQEKIEELAESIKLSGVLTPLLIREDKTGNAQYECLAGHTRKAAAKLAGLDTVPCIIKEAEDEEAEIIMVATNHQREDLLPVEKGWMYRIEYEAMKRKTGRKSSDELNGSQNGNHLEEGKKSIDLLAEKSDDSKNQIFRYMRVTYLIPFLAQLVDDKKIPLTIAADLSYLTDMEQDHVYAAATCKRISILPETAAELKQASREAKKEERELDIDEVTSIFEKHQIIKAKPKQAKYTVADEYFPDDYEKDEKQKYIEKSLKYIKDNGIEIKI